MSEETIVRLCSPTLAGIKTANMFSCECGTREELCREVRRLNSRLGSKGLRILPLSHKGGRALIYIYRPKLLRRDLGGSRSSEMLKREGYTCGNADICVAELVKRFRRSDSFPHEIGLFLGYPPEDVYGFIHHHSEGCKCVGCWKVYGDEAAARATFARYERCTEQYLQQYRSGRSVESLAVAM